MNILWEHQEGFTYISTTELEALQNQSLMIAEGFNHLVSVMHLNMAVIIVVLIFLKLWRRNG